jgi:FKBP-type peptidyl-prolyl cis-trans isomerase FkpA
LYLAAHNLSLMNFKNALIFSLFTFFLIGCKKDDNGVEITPPLPIGEVYQTNSADIEAFMATHTYNYSDFDNPAVDFDFKVKIDTLAGDLAGKTPLIQRAQAIKVTLKSEDLGLEDGETVEHTIYYIPLREGAGPQPTTADSTLVKYRGMRFNGTTFDASAQYLWQYLPFTIQGYGIGVSKLKKGTQVRINDDGTSTYTDSGMGMFIIPSALGYYNNVSGSIPAYENLIFVLELGNFVPDTDYDNDGIPSWMEDLNGNGIYDDDNTDYDIERRSFQVATPNHLDSDDDGDGIPTKDEITINADGTISFPDTDKDGIPDYLDKD